MFRTGLEDYIEDDIPAAPAVEEVAYDDEEDEVNFDALVTKGFAGSPLMPRSVAVEPSVASSLGVQCGSPTGHVSV